MADNYCQFSEVLPRLTNKEVVWWERQLEEEFASSAARSMTTEQILRTGTKNTGVIDSGREVALRRRGLATRTLLGFEYSIDTNPDLPSTRRSLFGSTRTTTVIRIWPPWPFNNS